MRSRTLLGAAMATALSGTLALGTAAPSTSAPSTPASERAEAQDRATVQAQGPEGGRVEQEAKRDDAVQAADRFLDSKYAAKRRGDDVVRRSAAVAGTKGTYYVTYRRTLEGLPVYGGDFVVAVDGSGKATGASDGVTRTLSVPTTTPVKGKAQARRVARRELDTVRTTSAPQLVVYAVGSPKLAWRTKVTGTVEGAPSITTVYSNARTGKVLLASEGVHSGTGNGYYYPGVTIGTSGSGSSYSMTDPVRSGVKCGGQNGAAYTGTDNVWGNGSGTNLETACVDVLYSLGKQVDMLSSWLGRNGVKGNGTNYPARVGLADVNAYFNGSILNFGHSSDNARQLTPIDIVAHEAGHGIFATTPGGSTGGNETGGLNEATGDIFGAMTEAYAAHPNDPADYLVGEEANLVGQGPIRNMANPSAMGDPNCYSSSIPNTEVHAAAGPLNHWFYLLAQGTNGSTTCNGTTLSGIGIQTAGQVFYNGLLLKTSSWTHGKARIATLAATKNLFGSTDCTTFNKVKAAWDGISVPAQSGEATCGGGGGTPTTCSKTTTSGTLANRTSQWKPSTSGFSTSGGTINACLTGPSNADFDLFLQKLSGSSWVDVASSETASSTEQIAYNAGSGSYRIEVYSYSGSGSYTLKYDTP